MVEKYPADTKPVLVTGATGYVGGRLVMKLLGDGYRVRAMARSKAKLAARSWAGQAGLELVEADARDLESLRKACAGCRVAYYLIHSMNPETKDFAQADRQAAENMKQAAAAAGLERIVYLGGLIPEDQGMSHHLASRAEVGDILASGSVPVTIFRAAMILGSGSVSFEIMRYLVDRLPVMITPAWVRTPVQPISIRNVLGYLVQCLHHEETIGRTFDICGPEVMTYQDLFQIYAREAGLPRRRILPIPFLTPKLSSYWIHLVTPVHSSIAVPLAEGLSNTVVCRDNSIKAIIPQNLMTCRETILRILYKREHQIVETCWLDAGVLRPSEWAHAGDVSYAGGSMISLAYFVRLAAGPETIWKPVVAIGGNQGWYYADFLWRLRGMLDKLAGGFSARRGRRHNTELAVGDALDFWRVSEINPPHHLMLVADMKTPGDAALEFRIVPAGKNQSEIRMISRFMPKGLWGLAYWYALLPFHKWIFKGMLKNLAQNLGAQITKGPGSLTDDQCRLEPGR